MANMIHICMQISSVCVNSVIIPIHYMSVARVDSLCSVSISSSVRRSANGCATQPHVICHIRIAKQERKRADTTTQNCSIKCVISLLCLRVVFVADVVVETGVDG